MSTLKPIDETEHIRCLLRTGSMMTHEKKMGLIKKIIRNTIDAIVKIRPETLTEGHDLTLPHQAYHFIGELRKEDNTPELAAYLSLLEACTRSVDNGQINADDICYAYAKTDNSLISGTKSAKGGELGRKKRDQINELEKETWRNTAKSIIAKRTHKISGRQLAEIVAKQLNPELCDEDIKKLGDSRRKWIANLL